ncbi:MAG: MGH1-like glycoside hydrolase domain-containing protein, partial [Acidimicrobiales bacterium]
MPDRVPSDATALTEDARRILIENDRGGYTVPSARLYPFQWNWDSVFVALGWAEFDMERAWQEIDTLFKAQWPSGMVPHIVFWTEEASYFPGPDVWRGERGGPSSSGISQPPVAATVVRHLIEAGGVLSEGRYDAIDRWHRWFHSARDPEDQGIIAVVHP